MKILLTTLNSKYIHSNLALKYLYVACQDLGFNAELVEFTINNPDDYIYGELLCGDYDLVCFSCYIWNIERTLYLVENLKKAKPNVKILLGGPEVTWRSLDIIKKNRAVDFILAGEGEENFPKFLKAFEAAGELKNYVDVGGLYYWQDDKIYVNPKAEPVDFASVAFPYKSLVSEPDKIIYYESVRGCPFSCSYCISAIEKGVRPLPVARVKEDLSYFIYKGVKQVKFVDRTFNYNDKRAVEIIRYIMERDIGKTNFHFEICGDIISNELLNLLALARAGLFQFEIGVQSTCEATLKAINRQCDFSLLSSNVKSIKEANNIHIHLDLIAGLPYEDYKSFAGSFNDVYTLGPDMLQLGFLKLLPGTPIWHQIKDFGYVSQSKAPYEVISNDFISSVELAKIKMVEKVLNLYYNRGGFEKTLNFFAGECFKSPFEFYESLAGFYYNKGFQHRSHNKEDLYRILYSYHQFLLDKGQSGNNSPKELLREDMDENLNAEAVRKFMKTGWSLSL